MRRKSGKVPQIDARARRLDEDLESELRNPLPENIDGRQVSSKRGSHSTMQKITAARPEFGARPGAIHDLENPAGTGRFRCSACGRYFHAEPDLAIHASECRAAKQSTASGARELDREDHSPHAPNDRGR